MDSFLSSVKKFENDLLKAWKNKDYNPEYFPDLVAKHLEKFKLHKKFPGKLEWLKFIAGNGDHTDIHHYDLNFTRNIHFTLFRNSHFFIDLYSWIDHTEIHSHNFRGAFQVMSGGFHQIKFSFDGESKIKKQITTGKLELVEKRHLGAGEIQAIHHGKGLIHQVLHTDLPAISICVRTPDTCDDYNSFFWPGLCLGEMLFSRPEYLRIKAFSQICSLEKKFDRPLAKKLMETLNSSSLIYDYMNDLRSFQISRSHRLKLIKLIEDKYRGLVDLKKTKKSHEIFLSKIELGI